MENVFYEVLLETLEISSLVFLMMVLIDFFDVKTRGKIKSFISKSSWNAYITTSFLGATPGCFGAYVNVSMYMHGFVGLGAISAGMIASCGDEAFVMLVQFPEQAILLFMILFVIAIPSGWLFDALAKKLNISKQALCNMHEVHKQDSDRDYWHYFTVHIWQHIFKKHVIKIIFWTFLSLLLIKVILIYFPIDSLVKENIGWVILVAALIGIIPESGPHLIFISLFATGNIPFSVLLTSSISQDGHGMLPMLSYSLHDSIIIKIYNTLFALLIGWLAFYMGF